MAERFQVRRTYSDDREDHISYITAGGEDRKQPDGSVVNITPEERALEVLKEQDSYAVEHYDYSMPTYELTEAPPDGPNPPQGTDF